MSSTESVDPSNAEQRGNWDGDAGAFWTAHADRFDQGVAAYHAQFLAAAAIKRTARVLDVGCGSGQTTRDAARCASAGSALGVDLSSQMIELARRRAESEQIANASFQQADAQVHPFSSHSFDLAISRHGAMFFGDPVAAFTNIARALRPSGAWSFSPGSRSSATNGSAPSSPLWTLVARCRSRHRTRRARSP